MAAIFDGRRWAKTEEQILMQKVSELKESFGVIPRLAVILIGSDPASKLYVGLKEKAAKRIGCRFDLVYYEDISSEALISKINSLNADPKIHGIVLQLPIPKELLDSKHLLLNTIAPEKDIDGLTRDSPYTPATVKAIFEIIEIIDPAQGALFVVVGDRGMVGKPLVKSLENQGLIVEGCNSSTSDLKNKTLKADILITATGTNGLIRGDMVKKGAFVIDVGSPKGDVEIESVAPKAKFLTPVPGGVGPVTITKLLESLLTAASIG